MCLFLTEGCTERFPIPNTSPTLEIFCNFKVDFQTFAAGISAHLRHNEKKNHRIVFLAMKETSSTIDYTPENQR